MLRHLRAAALLAVVAPSTALPAQPPLATAERLGDFYRAAERTNPRLAAARALARAADARIPGARRPPDPELQLGFMNRALPNLAPMPVLGMTTLQLMQMVPTAGKLGLAGRTAAARAAAARARADDATWELRAQVAMAYHDLVATDRSLAVARESLRLLQEVAQTAKAMYQVGEGRQVDVLRAQVEIARMTEDTLRMHAMRDGMVARLNATLDRPPATTIARVALPRFPATIPSRDWLDSVALDARPMLRAGAEEVRAAAAGETLARRELIPDLQVGIQYGQQRAMASDGMPAAGRDHMASLMIGASIPVFARSRQLQMRSEAAAMHQMATADLAAMRADTRGRIGEAYAALERARRLAALYRTEILPQALAAVTSAFSAYRVGGVDFMTLLDNRMSVNRYREELVTLDAEQGKAWAELEMLTGQALLDPDVVADDDAGPSPHDPPAPGGAA